MQNYKKILLILLILLIATILGYYVLIFLLGGPAMPSFFGIRNNDVETHEVAVEILDSQNNSIFKEAYNLSPNEAISEAKPFSLLYSIETKKYTFKITLDNGVVEKNTSVSLHRWSTVDIIIGESEEPIMIMIITV